MTSPDGLRPRLHGVLAFPVTPFGKDHAVDLTGLRSNLEEMLEHPISAIVAAGGTGELYSLSPDEHRDVVRTAVDAAAGRVPVIAGVGFNTVIGARLARQAADVGASGILAFPPYYPNPENEGLVAYYRTIADATPLALLVYSRDWFHPGPALLEQLADIPTFVGWKDGQGDIRRLQILQARLGDRLCWIGGAGDDLVGAYYGTGIRAFTSSIANIAPSVALRLHEAASTADRTTLDSVMRDLIVPLYAMRARRRGYEVTVMKELMNLLGLTGGWVRPPLPELGSDELRELHAVLPKWRSAREVGRAVGR